MTYDGSEEKKNRRFRRISAILVSAAVLILAFFLILILFRVETVEVSGNHHISEEELESQLFKGPMSGNSLFLRLFRHHPHLKEEPFVDGITIDYVDRHTVRVTVKEKALVGYVSYQGAYWYFDAEGKILVQSDRPESGDEDLVLSEEENPGADDGIEPAGKEAGTGSAKKTEAENDDLAESQENDDNAGSDGETDTASYVSLGDSDDEKTDAGESASSSGTVEPYYIPLVKGLSVTQPKVGEVLKVPKTWVFDALKSVTEIINKHDIDPDYVRFAEDGTVSLVVGSVTVKLGSDNHLEDKLEEMAAILPKTEGLSGILHLENFDGTQKRIIFDKSDS